MKRPDTAIKPRIVPERARTARLFRLADRLRRRPRALLSLCAVAVPLVIAGCGEASGPRMTPLAPAAKATTPAATPTAKAATPAAQANPPATRPKAAAKAAPAGVPQNNGGDGDPDNNAGPDDGDGGI
jgi:hypothetical protein